MKNVKETVISEFEIDFKKSCLSFSLNSTYTQSENGCGKQHFSVWNRVGIWRTGQHTPPKIPGNPFPPPRDLRVSKRNTLSYINRNLVPILREQLPTYPWNSHGNEDVRCFCSYFYGQNREPNIELYWTIPWSPEDFSPVLRDVLDLWPKAEFTRGETVTKNARKIAFCLGHY